MKLKPGPQTASPSDLQPWARNPRTITPDALEQLKRMMTEAREMLAARPLLVLPDGTVIGGNMRLKAARELGWDSIPIHVYDLDEPTAVEWATRDNASAGEYDEHALAELLYEHQRDGGDMEMTGLGEEELERLLALAEDDIAAALNAEPEPEPPADTAAIPVPKDPKSKLGEVYELGPHRLICGDCTDPAVWFELLVGDDTSEAMTFTSPPYSDARDYKGDKVLEPEYLAGFLTCAAEHSRISVVNLGIIRREGNVEPYWQAYIDRAAAAGLKLASWNIWYREKAWSLAQHTAMFPIEHEFLFCFARKPFDLIETVPNMHAGRVETPTARMRDGSMQSKANGSKREHTIGTHRAIGTVFTSPPEFAPVGDHPATFPVALPLAYIEAAVPEGGIVIEPFAGSGTTMIAAHNARRRARMIELDPGYCDVIRQRYADHTNDQSFAP